MISTRTDLERYELDRLAPYAFASANSRGRLSPEEEPRYRTVFQRDRDRIVHSAAFRRLEYKTQVFVNDAGDYYRTRLTHTLEVAQIGRTVARALGANEDLVEAICLAHDLGHPPFGHAGEESLDRLMHDHGGFNHNAQSFRVVTVLEERYERWRGLNLTRETLEGIAKHEASLDLSGLMGLDPTTRGTLEAQIANIVDELAYGAHDLDDGLLSGLIRAEQLEDLGIWRVLRDRVQIGSEPMTDVRRHYVIREQIGLLVDDLLETTAERLRSLKPQSPTDVQNLPENIVQFSEPMRDYSKELKRFLYANMYHSPSVITVARRSDRIIQGLFSSYVAEPRQLPRAWQARIGADSVHRVVTDYIACLTDRSAALEYRRMYDALTHP
ncbi:MAG: deoxyguanosinetriphosphate triphosphohydrolase [Chloroflexi bacterium]|nr:deoxyguanosinetriphosphate triphosphohydrolase [Chloroflexota bacterium]